VEPLKKQDLLPVGLMLLLAALLLISYSAFSNGQEVTRAIVAIAAVICAVAGSICAWKGFKEFKL
jgi:hypothetical protein